MLLRPDQHPRAFLGSVFPQIPAEIQNDLLCPPPPFEIYCITERRSRVLVRCSEEATQNRSRRELFEELRDPDGA